MNPKRDLKKWGLKPTAKAEQQVSTGNLTDLFAKPTTPFVLAALSQLWPTEDIFCSRRSLKLNCPDL